MGYQATGKIHSIDGTQQVSARFTKRDFVVELADNPRYPQFVQFQITGDRCSILDDFKAGDEIELEFSLRGREWTSPRGDVKYFNSLDVRSVRRAGAAASKPAGNAPRPAAARASGPPPDDDIPLPEEPNELPEDDIPF